jgi:hypothetical protein
MSTMSSMSSMLQMSSEPSPAESAESQPAAASVESQPVEASAVSEPVEVSAESKPVEVSAESKPAEASAESKPTEGSAESAASAESVESAEPVVAPPTSYAQCGRCQSSYALSETDLGPNGRGRYVGGSPLNNECSRLFSKGGRLTHFVCFCIVDWNVVFAGIPGFSPKIVS